MLTAGAIGTMLLLYFGAALAVFLYVWIIADSD